MTTPLRPGLEALPARMLTLPIDARGYPVPWFVAWVPGPGGVDVPEFRAMDQEKFVRAIKERRCWVCGDRLGKWLAFPIGPMCSITRTISEPPSHHECATWSLRNCPFLANPAFTRDEENLPAGMEQAAGLPINRNPGVMCLWMTRSFELFDPALVLGGRRGPQPLITIGEPIAVTWWREGRRATRAEVEHSVGGGFPSLLVAANAQGPFAVEELGRQYKRAEGLWPAE